MTGFHDEDFYSGVVDWYDLLDANTAANIRKSDNDMHSGKIHSRDMVYQLSFGNPVKQKWVRDQAKLIFNEEGKPVRIDGVTIDITDLIHAEQQLKISEEKYRLISENIQDIITIVDQNANVKYMSSSFSKITGYSADFYNSKSPFNYIHPDDVKVVKSFLLRVAHSEKDDKILFRFKKSNGEYMWLETLGSVLALSLIHI